MSEHAIGNAKGWLASIVEMVEALRLSREGSTIDCGQCEGTGRTASASNGEDEDCPVCDGSGLIDNPHDEDEARQAIDESPLSVEVREGWKTPGSTDAEPEEFRILLTTGGPALQIVGTLGLHGQPEDPRLQWQDWGTPWTTYHDTTEEEDSALEEFARCFYFGE